MVRTIILLLTLLIVSSFGQYDKRPSYDSRPSYESAAAEAGVSFLAPSTLTPDTVSYDSIQVIASSFDSNTDSTHAIINSSAIASPVWASSGDIFDALVADSLTDTTIAHGLSAGTTVYCYWIVKNSGDTIATKSATLVIPEM